MKKNEKSWSQLLRELKAFQKELASKKDAKELKEMKELLKEMEAIICMTKEMDERLKRIYQEKDEDHENN